MKKIVLLLVLLPMLAFSQNYQTIQPNVEVYFNSESSFNFPLMFLDESDVVPIRALRMVPVDSTKDGIYYRNHTEIHNEEYSTEHWSEDCVSPNMLSWIGNDVLIREDGYNVFFNRQNDSIFIDTQAQIYDSFIFCTFPDSSYFLATVWFQDTISFLGITDTTKSIFLQFYSADGQPATSPLNSAEIILSKNYGFYKTLNFRDFPNVDFGTFPTIEHTLYGHGNIASSFKKMTRRDIYDFEIGDKYHYQTDYSSEPYSWYKKMTREIINKEWLSNDSVEYTMVQHRWGYTDPPPYGNFYHYYDTIYPIYSQLDSAIANVLPFEPFFDDNDDLSFYIIKTNSYNNLPTLCITNDHYELSSWDTCYYNGIFDSGEVSSIFYIKGCGKITNYSIWDGGEIGSYYLSYLKYYKKGNDEWGTPLIPPMVGISGKPIKKKLISVFPNPSTSDIYFDIPNKFDDKEFKLVIVDSKGLKQIEKQITTSKNSVTIANWNEGIYFYNLSNDRFSESGKILVKH